MVPFRRLAREPLIQFLAVGAAIFFAAARLSPRADRRIVVTAGQIDRMIDTFSKTWMRPPTPQELRGLIEDYVKEEVYYREAIRLGLDQDDAVIRRRLRMKMEFWNEDAAAKDPTDAELSAFLAAHPERFRQPPRASFRQVFVSPARRRASARDDAEAILGELRRGADPASLGDPLPLPDAFDRASVAEIGRLFGEPFSRAVEAAPVGAWSGPAESAYGLHLILVRGREVASIPPLGEVREAVHREWLSQRKAETSQAHYAGLRERYDVAIEPLASPDKKTVLRFLGDREENAPSNLAK